MHQGDIKLDIDGFSVTSGGDFTLTTDDSDFVIMMLKNEEGAWKLHPKLGIGLEKYIGMNNNEVTRKNIRESIMVGLKEIGIVTNVIVLPTANESVVCNVELLYPDEASVEFSFNFQSGNINYLSVLNDEKSIGTIVQETNNIYIRRQ